MNLYLLKRTDKYGHEEFISIVVSAATEQDARETKPSTGHWCDGGYGEENVTLSCTHIGITDLPLGVIHESYQNP